MSTELLAKVNAACAFGTPNAAITYEILDEIRELQRKLDEIREFVQMWQSASENSDTGDLRMGDIAEVLDR